MRRTAPVKRAPGAQPACASVGAGLPGGYQAVYPPSMTRTAPVM
jgi:hypothetical protein